MKVVIVIFMILIFYVGPASADFSAYNDTVKPDTGSAANVTHYSGLSGGASNGLLMDYSTGLFTSVTASFTAVNVYGEELFGSMPNAGTDAYNVFNGIVNLSGEASYSVDNNWSYEITFTGLDPTKYYDFVTTANRDNLAYDGSGSASRWTKFSITGADTFTNSSSSGVSEISPDVLQMNTGYNTVNGYIISWSGISAADGNFTVRSENVGPGGPGLPYKSYGFQGFKLAEGGTPPVVPEPVSSVLFIAGGAALAFRRLWNKRKAA